MFYSYEFKAARAAGVGEDVDRNANDWAAFEARHATEKPSVVIEVSESGFDSR